MPATLIASESFYASLDALDDTDEVATVAEKLILRAVSDPCRVEPLDDTGLRRLRGGSRQAAYPQLCLYYVLGQDETVTLVSLDRDGA